MSMVSAKELRAQRAAAFEKGKEIVTRAESENRGLSAEEKVSFDAIHASMEELKDRYERLERADTIERELAETRGRTTVENGKTVSGEEKEDRAAKYDKAFRNYLLGGNKSLSNDDRMTLETRAQSTSGSGGGYTIPQGFVASVEKALKDFSGVRKVAKVIRTDSGNSLPWPTMDDTSNVGAIIAENATVSNQDVTFGQVTFGAYTYQSKAIVVSRQLLQDTGVDLVSVLADALGERIGRAQNAHFTTGTGSSQPTGIVTAAGTGVTAAAGNTTAITFANIVALEHSLDIAYRANAKFMMHDSTLKALKQLVDSQGRPLFLPGVAVREPDSILGYRYQVNNDMAVMAANAKSILFGDFSKFVVRDAGDIAMINADQLYAASYAIGLFGFARTDSNTINASALKLYINSAT